MGYRIEDFPTEDWHQYFEGSYVSAVQKKGGIRQGIISAFNTDSLVPTVVMTDSTGAFIVPLSSIRWEGVLGTRCVVYDNYLAFISHSGLRYHKKPPNSRNLVALLYKPGVSKPILLGEGMENGRVTSSCIQAYLNDTNDYPTSVLDVKRLIEHSQYAIPISTRSGLLWSPFVSTISYIKDGVVVSKASNNLEKINKTIECAIKEATHVP